jgi:hypothetical protein
MNAMTAAAVVSTSTDAAKICVAQVFVEVVQAWVVCPSCGERIGGFLSDPRGIGEVACPECDALLDVPASASLTLF